MINFLSDHQYDAPLLLYAILIDPYLIVNPFILTFLVQILLPRKFGFDFWM